MSRYHTAHLLIKAAPRGVPAQTHKGLDVLIDIRDHEQVDEFTEGVFTVEATDPSTGKLIGKLEVSGQSGHVDVDAEYRRQGVATLLYGFAEERLGESLVPSEEQTDQGQAFWDFWNPQEEEYDDDSTLLAGRAKWEMTQEYKGSDGGAYRDYHLNNNPRDGILTVELDTENGYRIRNVFVDESLQRKGTATLAYEMLNRESIKNTGKPLRSSEAGHARKSGPTSETPEAVALWESLVQKGEAERVGDHYQFIPPQATT